MIEPTGSRADAASTIFNLPDYRVIDAREEPGELRRVEVESIAPPGCPLCAVIATRGHSRRWQRLRDVPVAGPVVVWWRKRRWFCDQEQCSRGSFSEVTTQVPAFARFTARLRVALVSAVVSSGRAASEVARAHGVSWWLVATTITAAALVLTDPDEHPVRHLGVDDSPARSAPTGDPQPLPQRALLPRGRRQVAPG